MISMLSNSVKKVLPDMLQDAFLKFLNKELEITNNEAIAYAGAWLEISKVKGIYSSMKLDPHSRKLLKEWMDKAGIPNQVPADLLHCTIIKSEVAFSGYKPIENQVIVTEFLKDTWNGSYVKNYSIKYMGSENAIVLCFYNKEIDNQFWKAIGLGMQWPHETHSYHVTLSYNPGDFDLTSIKEMPNFDLVFEGEKIEALKDDFIESNGLNKFLDENDVNIEIDIFKKNEEKQLVYGWASVSKVNGEELFDEQGDYIDDENLINAAHDFIKNSRQGDLMHSIEGVGEIVESIVFTEDLQKSLGIDLGMTGWFIGVKVNNDAVWKEVKKGTFRAFSIGAKAYRKPVNE